jgi:hypothetical protein
VSGKVVTRRKAMVWTAKAGSAVAVGAWVAPKFETLAFAEGTGTGTGTDDTTGTGTGTGTAGSPCPNPDDPNCPDSSTTTSRPGAVAFVSCRVTPNETAPGQQVEVSGEGYKASGNVEVRLIGIGKLGDAAVQPDGTFARRFTIARSVPAGDFRVEVRGHNENGKEERCFSNLKVLTNGTSGGTTTTTTDGSGNSGSGGSDNNSGSDEGPLPFTGSDTTSLVAIGAGALILGRLLYEVRERLAERDGADAAT